MREKFELFKSKVRVKLTDYILAIESLSLRIGGNFIYPCFLFAIDSNTNSRILLPFFVC
ncbi:hypothetical protein JCM13991_03500 [Thermodesulfovibrio hydrogeniphilus]